MKTYNVTVTLLFSNDKQVKFPLVAQSISECIEQSHLLFPDYKTVSVEVA